MKTKNIFSLTLLLLLGLMAGACSDTDDTKTVDNGIRYGGASELYVYDSDTTAVQTMNFSLGASSQIVGIDSDGEWAASVADDSWVTLSNHSGYGYANHKFSYLKVTVTKNEGDTRTTQLTISSGGLSKVLTISQNGTSTDPGDPFMSGFTFVENLKLGYNLGNTLDANPWDPTFTWWNPADKTIADWETSWGQPLTTQEIISEIASKGFNVIRVPVTWFPHMDADGNVSVEWMDRVEQVVNYVLNAGCYCIINVQHDTGARDADRTDGAAWVVADMDEYPTISPRFKKLWTQIATRFRDYDDRLLFEAANEVLTGQRRWGVTPTKSDMQAYNMLEQDFVDAVRATGGNNEYRNLMVNPMGASGGETELNGFQAPTDVHPNHILASIHSYDPYWFCNDTDDKDSQTYYINVFDSSCESELDAIFQRVDKRFNQELGLPYFYGEFGAIGTHPDLAERIKYAAYMKQKFAQYSTSGLWWMGLIDRKTLDWYESEIVDALMK